MIHDIHGLSCMESPLLRRGTNEPELQVGQRDRRGWFQAEWIFQKLKSSVSSRSGLLPFRDCFHWQPLGCLDKVDKGWNFHLR